MLIKCPDCGNMRSSDADACPFCGCKRKPGSCLGTIVLFVVIILVLLSNSQDSYVVTRTANYREAPNGKILGQLSKGIRLSCEVKDGWCRTTYSDQTVYVSLKVLEKEKTTQTTQTTQQTDSAVFQTNEGMSPNQDTGLIQAVEN